jgi:hypothetical protein
MKIAIPHRTHQLPSIPPDRLSHRVARENRAPSGHGDRALATATRAIAFMAILMFGKRSERMSGLGRR